MCKRARRDILGGCVLFQSQGRDKAVPDIADHIRKFWDPRMRKAIFAHLDAGGAGLDPFVRDALETLKKA